MQVIIALVAILAFVQAKDFSINDQLYNQRIIGGVQVKPHSLPHVVAIFSDGQLVCGGSIISKTTVLTAAHCVDRAKMVEIVAGAHNITILEPTQQRIRVNSNDIIIHKDWNRQHFTTDIAIIRLNSLVLNDAVQPIKIDSGSCLYSDFNGTSGAVAGWGKLTIAGKHSSVLRQVTNTIMSNNECKRALVSFVQTTHICLKGNVGKSTCEGDDGNALLGTRNGVTVQIGILSRLPLQGCNMGKPSVYTRTACFYDWIRENMFGCICE